MSQAVLVLCALLAVSGAARAADETARVGNFRVKTERDRFGDHDTVIAEVMNGYSALFVRCLNGSLDVAYGEGGFGQGRWEEGLQVGLKFKVDSMPPVDFEGEGLSDKLLATSTEARKLVQSMIGAGEVALRIEARGVTFDKVFTLRQSAKAIPMVLKACGSATAPPQEKAAAPSRASPAPANEPPGVILPESAKPPDPPPAPPPAPDASTQATLHIGLSADDRERLAKVAGALIAAGRCGATTATSALANTLADPTDASRSAFGALAMGEALTALRALERADLLQSPLIEPAQKDAYCAKAASDYGPGGTVIPGAVNF